MSALSTHHKRTKRSETREEQRSTKEKNSSKWRKAQKGKNSHLLKQNRFPKTRATARRNRSKAKTWLLKDRGKARRSHARSGGKARKDQETKQSRHSPCKAFPSHKCNSPKMMHSQSPVCNKFKIQQVPPLFDHFSQKFLPLVGTCTHQAYNMAKPPPEIMLCNECRAECVSETFRYTKIWSSSDRHVCFINRNWI